MAFTKTWVGTTSDYSLDTNWQAINVRTPAYTWTVSGSGTNEYYLKLGSGNPGFAAAPTTVSLNGSVVTSGSLGSLAAGHWAYGDNDTLGYSTLYVRLADSTDPDSKVNGFVTFNQTPRAAENVRFPPNSGTTVAGGDYSSLAIADFVVEPGNTTAFGSATAPLIIDPDSFIFYGNGTAYIDVGSAAISPQVYNTAGAGTGAAGLYLTGTALATVNVIGGTVGLAWLSGQIATVTTIRTVGNKAITLVGKGVSLTAMYATDGSTEMHCAATTATYYGGTHYTKETGAITTMNVRGNASVFSESTGTIATLNAEGGVTDFTTSGASRTVSTLKKNPGSVVKYDPAVTTVTTRSAPDYPVSEATTAA